MTPDPAPLVPDPWRALVDDAAIFPPGDAPLHDATATFGARREEWYADLVGTFVLRDTDLPLVRGFDGPLSVVVTGGAGQLAGPVSLASRLGLQVAALEIAVRDLDDPVGNVRRIDAAARAAEVDVPLFIEIPGPPTAKWLAAADEVAASEHRLKLRLGHVDHDLIPDPTTVIGWIDAALDRETPFKATAGLHRAVSHDPAGGGAFGFLNLMVATQRMYDGMPDPIADLQERNPDALLERAGEVDLVRSRRWMTSFGSCSVTEPRDDLAALGLLTPPPAPRKDTA